MKNYENPSKDEVQRDVICAYLGRSRELWLGAKDRAERAAGLDANLNTIVANHIGQLNRLLDELIEVPGIRYES